MKTIIRYILQGLILLMSLDIVVAQNDVTFQVEMKIKIAKNVFHPEKGDIVFVSGNFNVWGRTDTLTDLDGDGIYKKTISLPTGPIEYKFQFQFGLNSYNWEASVNRNYTVADGPQIIPLVFYEDDVLDTQFSSVSATVLEGRDIRLDWITTQEYDNFGFSVQRRDQIDTNFIDIPNSFIQGSGTVIEPHSYSWTNLNVTPGFYDYRVGFINSTGDTLGYSNIVTVHFLPIPSLYLPPNAATNVSLSPILSWDTIKSAISYRLQVALDSMFTTVVHDDSIITMTSKRVEALAYFTQYFWRIQAKDSNGTSAYSTPRNFKTIIGPPTNISANSGNHSITLKWTSTHDSPLLLYRIHRDTSSPASTLIDSVPASESLYVNTGMSNGKTYYYRLTSVDSQLTESPFSNEVNATPFIAPLTNLLATPGNHQIILNWTASTTSSTLRYRIYRGSSSPASTLIDSVLPTITTCTNVGLTNGVRYYYRVTAVDSQLSNSQFSNEVSAVPFNRAPVVVQIRDTTMSNVGRELTNSLLFSCSGSYDPDGNIDSVYWYVNNVIVGRDTILLYKFGPGTSKVMLIIQDNDGARDTSRATVTRSVFKRYLNGPVTAGLSLLGDSVLYAIATGDAIYRLDIDGNILYTLQVGGNVLSASSIAYDTIIYIASTDRNLYAFNRFGAPVWPALPLGGELSATATIDSLTNRLYIGVQNRNFFAINRASGKVDWSYFSDAPIKNSAVITADRKLILSTIRGTIYGFDLANLPTPPSPTWMLSLNDTITSSPAIDPKGFFYVGTKSGHITKISLQQGGHATIVWQTQTGSSIYASPIIDGNGVLYIGSLDSKFYAIDTSNGDIYWQFQTSGPIQSTAAVSTLRTVYFGNDAGQFYALDSLGNIKWWYQDSAAIRSPILYDHGTVYVGTEAGKILAFFDDEATTMNSKISFTRLPIWGTFQGNNARTGVLHTQISTDISNDFSALPIKYSLHQNYPNPFNPNTTIRYDLPQESRVVLKVFNILGQEVVTVVDGVQQAGWYSVQWDAGNVASGLYFYQMQTGEFIEAKKLLLLK